MFAIRSRNGKRPFRRSGVEFDADAWTFQDEITDAQKGEPMLLILEVDSYDDARLDDLTPLLKEEDETPNTSAPSLAENSISAEVQARLDDLQQCKDRLAGEVVTLQAQVSDLTREHTALQSDNETLKGTLQQFAQANEELGNVNAELASERDRLQGENETLKAAQTASVPPPSVDDPADPTSNVSSGVPTAADATAPVSEPSGKEATGKAGKNATAN